MLAVLYDEEQQVGHVVSIESVHQCLIYRDEMWVLTSKQGPVYRKIADVGVLSDDGREVPASVVRLTMLDCVQGVSSIEEGR